MPYGGSMVFLADWKNLLWSMGVLISAVAIGLVAHRLILAAVRRAASRTRGIADDLLIKYSAKPSRLVLPTIAALMASPGLPVSPDAQGILRHLLVIVLIGGVTWLMISQLGAVEELLNQRYRIDVEDNLEGRRVRTQVHVLRRVTAVVFAVIGFAIVLMTFPTIWNIGAGLFASAGAAGLVVGMAAKPTLSSLIAGIQIALTEPIRLDDVVIVEGEWGRIEEVLATYVVVRIWDQRRLILPLTYFIEHPFQNWTRTSSDILGTVFLHVDYTLPIDEMRSELRRILESTDLWDGRVCVLQVTDAKPATLEVRALMSAKDSGKAWDLRCLVRERLIRFVQTNYPGSLPRTRADLAPVTLSESARV